MSDNTPKKYDVRTQLTPQEKIEFMDQRLAAILAGEVESETLDEADDE